MITKASVEKIIDTARIDEVVGDFVQLRKRGSNLHGLCPFHNEKTPSFSVNVAKGIYKCFGCGKAGDSVNFVMEHEHYTFAEALRYLAGKYHIEIEETEQTDKDKLADKEKESLYTVNEFATRYFQEILNSEEGLAIGMSYFKERGFTNETIKKFQLGYAVERWDALTLHAIEAGYSLPLLERSGLTIIKDDKQYDRFRGRVIFPIQNITGRTIAFGARILKNVPNQPKYVNSPETEIYNKSKSLYGIFQAKKMITALDECLLCEGYTDVISLHQAGIENAVASSGTSLTEDQIKLISRYTKNITVLYDGDAAGIKASLRGIDMILEQGLNVHVLLFPEGDDPDSFSKKVSTEDLRKFIQSQTRDFMLFKTELLLEDAGSDPLKKAALIKDIVQSIAKIPDAIIRSMYTKQCATLMQMDEQVLIIELNKIRRQASLKRSREVEEETTPEMPVVLSEQPMVADDSAKYQEQELVRLMLNFGDHQITLEDENDNPQPYNLLDFIISEINNDEIEFEDKELWQLFNLLEKMTAKGEKFSQEHLTSLQTPETIRNKAIGMLTSPYTLSEGWEQRGIFTVTEDRQLRHAVLSAIYTLKIKKVMQLLAQNGIEIQNAFTNNEPFEDLLVRHHQLEEVKIMLSKYLSMVIIK